MSRLRSKILCAQRILGSHRAPRRVRTRLIFLAFAAAQMFFASQRVAQSADDAAVGQAKPTLERTPAAVALKSTSKSEARSDLQHASLPVDFYRDVKPIFVKHCFACHGPSLAESRFRLDQRTRALEGGDNGPAIVAGNSEGSRLIQFVTGKNSDGEIMPPKDKGVPLSEQEIAMLRSWIDQGAPWPDPIGANRPDGAKPPLSDHWAFQSVQPVKPPIIHDAWIETPIDAFVMQKLRENGLTPNPQAKRGDLIRRVTFDLIGLPPTPEEVQRFEKDTSEDAYERLVDRLLASPRYGERWARHWLDLARYADSDGFENDGDRPNAYKYRDYVIRSFNADKPFDQFIVEQLAGDELDDTNPENLVALGFCRNQQTVGNQINEKNRTDEIDDIVSTTSSVFLGLSVGCARCHDHKYEPITQIEYYRMFAVFNGLDKRNDQAIMHVRDLTQRKTYVMLGGDYNRHGDEVQPGVPAVVDNGRAQFPAEDLTPTDPKSTTPRGHVGRRLTLAKWIADPENPLTARVLANRIWMYHFGRGLVNTPSNFGQSGDAPTHAELIDFLAGELYRNGWKLKPLHKEIVMSAAYRQASDYDPLKAGLDPDVAWYWRFPVRRLEAEAIRDGILSVSGKLNLQMYGPGVKPRIPESVIATGSKVFWPKVSEEGPEQWRRSVYVFLKRSVMFPMLEGFDAPTATQSCERRMTTTVATQALQLMNDDFSNDQAGFMAERIIREVGDTPEKQVDRAYWLSFSRAPTDEERNRAVEFINQRTDAVSKETQGKNAARSNKSLAQIKAQSLADLCHVLFNSNEFVYVD
jgi:hypothetical protein